MAFVSGAAIVLYTNPKTATEVRRTDDIDMVVELATYGSYAKLEERLREIAFVKVLSINSYSQHKQLY